MPVVEFRNPYRAANGKSIVVLAVAVPQMAERTRRAERFIRPILVGASVELIGSGFGREVVESSHHLAVFRREVGRLHGELRDRLYGSRCHAAGPVRIVVAGGILAFQIHFKVPGGQPIYRRVVACPGNTGRQNNKAKPVADSAAGRAATAEVQWQIVNLFAADVHALFGILTAQQRSLGHDGD